MDSSPALQPSKAHSSQKDSSNTGSKTVGKRVSTLSFDPTKIVKPTIPRDDTHKDTFLGSEFSKEGLLCTSCGETFSTPTSLDLHMKLHVAKEQQNLRSEKPRFHSNFDDDDDDWDDDVPTKRKYKQREQKYECSICQKKFGAKEMIRNHMKIHSGETPFQCPLCEKRFALGRNLHRHIKSAHKEHEQNSTEYCAKLMQENSPHENKKVIYTGDKERPYKCAICAKTFRRLYRVKSHTRSHSGQKPFMCSHCNKLFSSSDNLSRHVRKIHNRPEGATSRKGRKPKKEPVAEREAEKATEFISGDTTYIQIQDSSGSTYNIPVQRNGSDELTLLHSPRQGELYSINGDGADGNASTYFIDLQNPQGHHQQSQQMTVQMVHQGHQGSGAQHQPPPLPPPTQRLELEHHQFQDHVHNIEENNDMDDDDNDDDDRGFSHVQEHDHTHTTAASAQPQTQQRVGGAFQCSLCRETFSSGPLLSKHISTHKFNTPSKCHVCGKEFKQESYLKRHMICHSDEKPFKCSMCPKAFNRMYRLNNHWRTHTGERPYVCSVCNKTFAISDNLYKHIRKIHKGLGIEYAASQVKQVQETNREKKYALLYGDYEVIEDQENV